MSRLPLPLVLALRYLRSTRRDAFVTFLCSVTAGGMALGVAALILALAALSGFQSKLLEDVLARSPTLEVLLDPQDPVAPLLETVRATAGVESAQELLYGRGWLLFSGSLKPVELVGFAERPPSWFPGVPDVPPTGLFVPQSVAADWNLWSGDRLRVVSSRSTLTPVGPKPRMRQVAVSGTYQEGRSEPDAVRVALPLRLVESLVERSDPRLDVELARGASAEGVAQRLRERLPAGASVVTWRDLNRPLVFVLRLEKGIIFLAVLLIVLVAALALVASLAMIITSRLPEIGILGAMGASSRTLHRTFLLLGTLLAGLGSSAGGALGVSVALLLDRFRLLSLPGEVYIVDYVPFLVRPADLAVVILSTFLLTMAASLWGARRAAALQPLQALQR